MAQNELIENIQADELLKYCLGKDGAYVDFPFGVDCPVVKVKNGNKSRIFAEIFELGGELKLTFSTDEMTALALRAKYPQIVRGWHCPPIQAKFKSTVAVDSVSKELLFQFVDLSYERVISKLK